MEVIEITFKKITPKEGFLLTNGDITTDVLYMRNIPAADVWWEIPDPDYIPQFDGTDYLRPITWEPNMEVITGLWYTDGVDVWEAIKNGIPISFEDREYFDIID